MVRHHNALIITFSVVEWVAFRLNDMRGQEITTPELDLHEVLEGNIANKILRVAAWVIPLLLKRVTSLHVCTLKSELCTQFCGRL